MKPVGVLLAAGNSTRFGGNKLTHLLDSGDTIGLRSGRHLISELDECIAVVRNTDIELGDDLSQLGFKTVIQPNPEAGMGNSLSRAIQASKGADGWIISLADMPWIKSETLRLVIASVYGGAPVTAPVYHGKRGHPVGFNKRFRDELLALDGDTGARTLLCAHAELIQLIDVDDPGILHDVDTLDDLNI